MFYVNADGDGFGNPEIVVEICELPSGYVNNESDCDDAHSQKYPGAEEICDQLDSNCNGDIDEGLEQYFFVDNDGDGIGSEEIVQVCILIAGTSTLNGDCDDTNPELHPLIIEICDEIDHNCSDDIDEGLLMTFCLESNIGLLYWSWLENNLLPRRNCWRYYFW